MLMLIVQVEHLHSINPKHLLRTPSEDGFLYRVFSKLSDQVLIIFHNIFTQLKIMAKAPFGHRIEIVK